MTIKLVLLKSGEDVIADIQEMILEENTIGYFFNNPCSVKVFVSENNDTKSTKTPYKLQLTPWIPLTLDKKITVPLDWVVTMVEPIEQLREMYEKNLPKEMKNGENNKSFVIDEQCNSDQSD